MAIPYTSLDPSATPNFTTPRTQQCWVEYPFSYANDSTSKLYHHLMVMPGNAYTPLAYNYTMEDSTYKPLGSLFPDDANAFWVGDRNVAPIGDNLVQFDRMFATVPAARTEGAPNYNFTFPKTGANGGSTAFKQAVYQSTDFTVTNGIPETQFKMSSANSSYYNVGDEIFVDQDSGTFVRFVDQPDTTETELLGAYVIYSKAASGTNFLYHARYKYPEILSTTRQYYHATHPNFYKRITYTRQDAVDQRDVDSLIDFRYVRTDDILTVETADAFIVESIDSNYRFEVTDQLSATSSPSLREYNAITGVDSFINGEPESARRWMGNIWEFATRRVRAN